MTTQQYQITHKQLEGQRFVNSIGMLMTLISFAMLFATMFLAYAFFRMSSDSWPPEGMDKISLFYPTISSIIIFISSLVFYIFEKKFTEINRAIRRIYLGITFFCGVLFLFSQIKLWHSLSLNGVYASSGIFPSLVYTFTWVHAAHIILALLSLIYLSFTVLGNQNNKKQILKIQNVGKFWHFLTVIWFFIFISIFVL